MKKVIINKNSFKVYFLEISGYETDTSHLELFFSETKGNWSINGILVG